MTTQLPTTYKAFHLAKRPDNEITHDTFELKTHSTPSLSSLKDGEVIFQPHYLSLDPAMRTILNDVRSYIPPVAIGAVMLGMGVGTILASKSPKLQVGDTVYARCGWCELAVMSDATLEKIDTKLAANVQKTDYLGMLGMTGLTAYFGVLEIGKIKAGDFVVVSGAAGATGSIAGQIAKIQGATVLGIAGSDEKCRWLVEELGFDAALNYRAEGFAPRFLEATKDLIDVYFDNVGGEVLDLALSQAREHSTIVLCGGISQYNSKDVKGPKNYLNIITMRIRMQGFIVFDYVAQFPQAQRSLAQWLSEGKIKRQETIVKGGIEMMPGALQSIYSGANTGKLMVELTPPGEQRQALL